MPLTPEILVPRIGDALVEQNLLSPEQLATALQIQSQERARGNNLLIGQVLVEHGFISQASLNQAITQQILLLHEALQRSNATLEQRVNDRTRELEIAYQKLSELSKLKANFVSNISHELRTPLTHIKGYINLLVEGDLDSLQPDQQYALRIVEKASDRLSRLIEDLILFSTSETSTLQINKEIVDLIKLVNQAIEQNKANAEAKKITISLDSRSDAIEVTSDELKVAWVLNQLIDNALKYTSPGGKVVVSVQPDNDKVEISVFDTGLGIPPDKIGEIFEPFHQLDESSTRQQGGTGLGLSLAKKIIEALGSKLIVTSSLGKGSNFKFLL
jgi:two-component system phosphate regulon sensor histidine kinase PhoR